MSSFTMNAIIIRQICQKITPGKKALQKLMYLISRKGVVTDLNYSIHYFGPYSVKLDNMIHVLESYDQLNVDTSGPTHRISKGDIAIEGTLNDEDQRKVDFVLEKFLPRTPHELEAITTIDYVAVTMLKDKGNDEEIIERVQKIKGSKFTSTELRTWLTTLKALEYVH